MKMQSRPWVGRLGIALLALGPTLSGCNLVAGVLVASADSADRGALVTAELPGGPRELKVALRPGVSLLQAAARAPHALSSLRGAARQLGNLSMLSGDYLSAVSSGLLGDDQSVLLPGPLGALEVTLEVRPEPSVEAPTIEPWTGPGAEPDCQARRAAPELVGAYQMGSRLLLLRADGEFILTGGTGRGQSGHYAPRCQGLQLVTTANERILLAPLPSDGWRDGGGAVFLPLTEKPHGDIR